MSKKKRSASPDQALQALEAPEILTDAQAQALSEERSEAEEAIDELTVTALGGWDVGFAEDELGKVQARWKEIEAARTQVTKPLNEALRGVNGWFRPVQTALKTLERRWKEELKHHRLRAAEQQRVLLEAARTAVDPEEQREALIQASAAVPQTTKVTYIERWVFEVVDPASVPAEYLCPDLDKIGKVVAALKEGHNIPGVRAYDDAIVRGSSK